MANDQWAISLTSKELEVMTRGLCLEVRRCRLLLVTLDYKQFFLRSLISVVFCSHPLCENQAGWPAADEKLLNYQLLVDPLLIYNNVNITDAQRDMCDFHDDLYEMGG